MSSLKAIQLLSKAALIAKEERKTFSGEGISKKIQDIKYLSSQKKVPRLSLRKEVILLENQLQKVVEVEEKLSKEKDKESIAVAALKQQITILKNKLKAVEDLALEKKVNHLSFLLGEHLARKEIPSEVALSSLEIAAPLPTTNADLAKKAEMLQKRLEALKQELNITKELGNKTPAEIRQIEERIKAFEEKLREFYEHYPEAMPEEGGVEGPVPEVKHTLLFAEPKEAVEVEEEVKEAERELPLPPPPRMRRRD